MGKYDKLVRNNNIEGNKEKQYGVSVVSNYSEIQEDVNKTIEIYNNAGIVLNDIDAKFQEATHLEKDDIGFLFFAVALQCIRQYVLTSFPVRKGDQEAAKNTKGHNEEHSSRKRGEWYLPTPREIILNPVPYDANRQISVSEGALKGNGKMGHRLVLGHDPVLGWIFGTSNIATSTLTTNHFATYHIKTKNKMDYLSQPANTLEMLMVAGDRFFLNGIKGAEILATSLAKEWIHLKSDIYTKNSLPIPILSTISPELTNLFAKYGLDMGNIVTVTKQAFWSQLINMIISILHGMYCYYIKYPDDGPKQWTKAMEKSLCIRYEKDVINELELCKVRTRKILLYSNLIASSSNILVVSGTEVAATLLKNPELAKKGLQYVDIGGYMVTIYRLISDVKFINNIKKDFLENEWANRVLGEDYTFFDGEE